jgi:hypothetical protein
MLKNIYNLLVKENFFRMIFLHLLFLKMMSYWMIFHISQKDYAQICALFLLKDEK